MSVPNRFLSAHFTLQEMLLSQTAVRFRYNEQFSPSEAVVENLQQLCQTLLEPIRQTLNQPLTITSGYRCKRVNKKVGGSKNSQHLTGEAADIVMYSMTVEGLFQFIKGSGLPFDQLIQEFDSWVHISFRSKPRGQVLRAVKLGNGHTRYLPG